MSSQQPQHNYSSPLSSSTPSSSGPIIDQYLKQIYEQVHLGLKLEEGNLQPLEALQHYGLAVQSIGSILQSRDLIQHLSVNQLASLKMIYEKCTERVLALLNIVKNPTTSTSIGTSNVGATLSSQKRPEYFGIVKHHEEKVFNSQIDQLNDQFNMTRLKLIKLDNEQAELVKKINESNQSGDVSKIIEWIN